MRQFLIYFVSSLTCMCMLIPQVVFANPAAAVAMAIVTGLDVWMDTQAIEEYQEWRETHPNNPISDFTDSFNGAHRALGVTLDPDGFSGHDGQLPDPSEITWTNNDKSFNDFDSAYQDYVSDLPCGSIYDSSGSLIWYPDYTVEFTANSNDTTLEEIYVDKILTITDKSIEVKLNPESSSNKFTNSILCNLSVSDIAPIDGTYKINQVGTFIDCTYKKPSSDDFNHSNILFSNSKFNKNRLYLSSGDTFVYNANNFKPDTGTTYLNYLYWIINDISFLIIPQNPTDTVITNNYNDNSRAWSLTGGLALTNISGGLTTINPDVKIINETNNTYTNPETGITYPVSDWTYDYSDRSYTLHLDTTNVEEGDTIGDTVVVTYGDENIAINEQHITYEGDTPVTTTETIPVYYIIENPQSQDPDDPGTVVDPGSDPDDSGCSCLCTKIGQQIAAGAFAYTNSGSGDFYSYVNIANGGTTTNNNTYNYYGSGPHDPTPPNSNTDPENPDDTGTEIEPVTPCANNDHWFVITEDVPATCTSDGYRKGKCSECGLESMISYTPAYGHNWEGPYIVGETVELNPGQDPFMTEESPNTCFYVCSRCGMHYVVPSMDTPAPPANYDPEAEPGFFQNVPSAFSGLANIFNNIISTVVDMCSNFTNFLVAVFPFIPTEFITVLELGFVLFVAAGVIRYFLR